MNKLNALITLGILILATFAWQVGQRVSVDAIMLGLGVLLGMMAGIPAAMMAASRQTHHHHYSQPQAPAQVEDWGQPRQALPSQPRQSQQLPAYDVLRDAPEQAYQQWIRQAVDELAESHQPIFQQTTPRYTVVEPKRLTDKTKR